MRTMYKKITNMKLYYKGNAPKNWEVKCNTYYKFNVSSYYKLGSLWEIMFYVLYFRNATVSKSQYSNYMRFNIEPKLSPKSSWYLAPTLFIIQHLTYIFLLEQNSMENIF